jgi:hypothetical protein
VSLTDSVLGLTVFVAHLSALRRDCDWGSVCI